MTPELEEKINNLVEILYQNEYIDGYLYNRRKIDWTDKGHDFMKKKNLVICGILFGRIVLIPVEFGFHV